MARDAGLEELIRNELQTVPGVSEKAMFGGLAWLLNDNLLCGARDDGMLVRLGKGQDSWALRIHGVAPMQSGRRTMLGWVRCNSDVFGDDKLRKQLIACAVDFVRSLSNK